MRAHILAKINSNLEKKQMANTEVWILVDKPYITLIQLNTSLTICRLMRKIVSKAPDPTCYQYRFYMGIAAKRIRSDLAEILNIEEYVAKIISDWAKENYEN